MLDVVDISRFVAAAAKVRLAACDGMNPQAFVLPAHDFFEAFTGRHVKRLRAGLGFVLRQLLYDRGTKSRNPGGHVWSPAGRRLVIFCGTTVDEGGIPSAHIAPFLRVVNAQGHFRQARQLTNPQRSQTWL